ncbi:MAG: protein-L-isoaspartate O-methyltransferase [Geminicoccaceae bacterium]|jgi:protein-L-isoaspartate(D-aspartate) O-methyltransferase|nr:MAG: protein-L-isoaspartate O-methyltransferase [Geminicoccaceae bacterium]
MRRIRRLASRLVLLALVLAPSAGPFAATAAATDLATARAEMIRRIEAEAAATASMTGIVRLDPRVLEAMGEVARERFVPAALRERAYGPGPLPVHPEQNLADPFLTALMLHLAEVKPGDPVFETGTDTGYLAALLVRMGARVTSVEILPELAALARRLLADQPADRLFLAEGDGYNGWPERAPFAAIIVKEAVDHLPPPLLAQLAEGGRLVLPLGPADGVQHLTVVVRRPGDRLELRRVLPVRFTPFQRGGRT